jgi:hypothetical protein
MIDNLVEHLRRHLLAHDEPVHQLFALTPSQSVQNNTRYILLSHPRRGVFRTLSNYEQDGQCMKPWDERTTQGCYSQASDCSYQHMAHVDYNRRPIGAPTIGMVQCTIFVSVLPGDRDQGDAACIEGLDDFGKVGERAS